MAPQDTQTSSSLGLFLKSYHHAWLAAATVGLGLMSASPLMMIGGVVAYVLGIIYLPDSKWFQKWLFDKQEAVRVAGDREKIQKFTEKREAMFDTLCDERKAKYWNLATVCKSIRFESSDATDPRVKKLEELVWTYLKLLVCENNICNYLVTEEQEDIQRQFDCAEKNFEKWKKDTVGSADEDTFRKISESKEELLNVLRKRLERYSSAKNNLSLVVSEEERLEQQIKLIRADSIAMQSSDVLTTKIDSAINNIEHTNQWLKEMNGINAFDVDFPDVGTPVGIPFIGGDRSFTPSPERMRPQAVPQESRRVRKIVRNSSMQTEEWK